MDATRYLIMQTSNLLHFSWSGDEKGFKGLKEPMMYLYVNGTEYVADWDYNDGFTIDIPINTDTLNIEVKIGKKDAEKKTTYFKHEFVIFSDADYSARLEGQATSFTGLNLKLSKPNADISEDTPACHRNLPIAMLSFCFPIYGIIDAIRSPYNRKTAIISASVGFILAMIFSAWTPEGAETGIAFGRIVLLSYEPFSFLDWIVNILVGGIASLRGFLYLLLECLV